MSSTQPDTVLSAQASALLARDVSNLTIEECDSYLHQLIALHEAVREPQPKLARRLRQRFLVALQDAEHALDQDDFRRFIVANLSPRDFTTIKWESAEDAVTVVETLYGIRSQNELPADQATSYVVELLRTALRHFERQRDYENMFDLLQRAPIPPSVMDAELIRLRSRLHLYEMRRVRRLRRSLYGYLALQALMILLVFPYLFIHFENGAVDDAVEQTTETVANVIEQTTGISPTTTSEPSPTAIPTVIIVEKDDRSPGIILPPESPTDEPRQILSFFDGIYWATITAASIGYGDVTPVTRGGKILAAILGTMGVVTVGVLAGLILDWLTPRRLP